MISNGPSLVEQPGESNKEEEFIRLLKEELLVEKIIVFTRFKKGIPALEIACERNGIPYTKITGDVDDHDRTRARIRFQTDPDCRVLFITMAGSAALNLQAAGVIIFYDTPWSYGDLVQTIGRAQRIGSLQEHILVIHLVNKGPIDMRVINKVTSKKELSDEVVGVTAQGALDFSYNQDAEIDDLYQDLLKDAEAL
jgi:SNF2 family DNA or RNA helicase